MPPSAVKNKRLSRNGEQTTIRKDGWKGEYTDKKKILDSLKDIKTQRALKRGKETRKLRGKDVCSGVSFFSIGLHECRQT